jgi:hypothetical protein
MMRRADAERKPAAGFEAFGLRAEKRDRLR